MSSRTVTKMKAKAARPWPGEGGKVAEGAGCEGGIACGVDFAVRSSVLIVAAWQSSMRRGVEVIFCQQSGDAFCKT
jgi:hypothetical protein